MTFSMGTVRWVRSLGPGTLVRSLSIRGVRNGRYGTVGTESWYVGIGLLVRWVRYSRYGTVGAESWYAGIGLLVRWVRYGRYGTVGTVGGMVR